MKKKQHLNKKIEKQIKYQPKQSKGNKNANKKKHNKSKFDDSFVSGQSKLGQHGEYDQFFHGEYSVM